jgi:hypothetical protein
MCTSGASECIQPQHSRAPGLWTPKGPHAADIRSARATVARLPATTGRTQPGVPKMHTLAHAQYRSQSPPSLCTRHGCRKRAIDAAIGWSDDEWDARTSLALFADVIFESTYDTLGHTLDLRPGCLGVECTSATLSTATSALSALCLYVRILRNISRESGFACRDDLRMPLKGSGSSLLE